MTPREPLLAGEVLSEREGRTLSDPQRLLWREDVEDICPSIGICFEYGDTVRCGPCAIKQADQCGVNSNLSLPNLPEVSRLRRVLRALGHDDGATYPTPTPSPHRED